MISVVIPARNEQELLPSCLESLKSQDYQGDYEIIVADNGSTDGSARIALGFGARVVPCAEKNSVFYARQVGAAAARGEIIVQADADTVYPRGWLTRIDRQFANHPDTVALAGRFVYTDPTIVARPEYLARDLLNRATTRLMGKPLLVSGATFAFRREAFLRVGGYEGLTYAADQYGIASRLRKIGKIIYDSQLRVSTSSRSVQKPLPVLAGDVMANIARFCLYLGGSFTGDVLRTRPRRLAASLIPVSMVIILIGIYGYFIPASPVFGKVYSKGSPWDKVVALSFDDGPNEPYTSQVLDILKERNVRATFFLIGYNVDLFPQVARRIIAEGNVIGNHSYGHNANHALSQSGVKDAERAQAAIFSATGVIPHLYRPPHGRKSPWEMNGIKKLGLVEVAWTVSTKELAGKTAAQITQQILSKTDAGEIILLHDGYGTSHSGAKADKSVTVQSLPELIDQLHANGYHFVTIPELLEINAYHN